MMKTSKERSPGREKDGTVSEERLNGTATLDKDRPQGRIDRKNGGALHQSARRQRECA
jgi:hypothetical protein